MTISYLFTRDDGYQDGEEYTIPILAQGTELAEGTLGTVSYTHLDVYKRQFQYRAWRPLGE